MVELDDGSELIVKRSWSAGAVNDAKAKDLEERLVVVQDGKRVSMQNRQMWQDFIRATIPPGITQFFFFDGEKEVFALSLLWGLAQTSQLKLPILIDTPLSRLDSTHRDNIIKFIAF